MKKKTILSGIQPSGTIHLGNYLGAIKQWIEMQDDYESYFCIVDLHAITVQQDPKELRENVRKLAALYLACGLDPEKSNLFVQSQLPVHTELGWILNCYTQMGELERMTQYKDKAKNKKRSNVGLFSYPVLMAADILLYQTDVVPVGEDQKQHVELCRDIAQRFNNIYGKVFTVPELMMAKSGARIMALDDPSKKMSKSAESENSYVSFEDEPKKIRKKIMKAVTDSGDEIKAGKDKPALTNLLTIYSLLSGKEIKELEQEYKGKGYGDFKKDLAEVVVNFVEPIQKKYKKILKDKDLLDQILEEGLDEAGHKADDTLHKVKKVIGLE